MSKAEALLVDLLTLVLLLAMFSLPAFPQIEYRARITIVYMIFGLVLIIGRKGERR